MFETRTSLSLAQSSSDQDNAGSPSRTTVSPMSSGRGLNGGGATGATLAPPPQLVAAIIASAIAPVAIPPLTSCIGETSIGQRTRNSRLVFAGHFAEHERVAPRT